jgi:hypothetical protein
VSDNRSRTRRGVKANHPGEKLVTVTNGVKKERVSRSVAANRVATGSWKYCPKKFKLE